MTTGTPASPAVPDQSGAGSTAADEAIEHSSQLESSSRSERAPKQVWRERQFGRYLGGFGLSLLGDQVWFVALAWAAVRLGDATEASVVMMAGSVPRAILLLLGGTLADRWGALRVTLGSQMLRVLLMALVAITSVIVSPSVVLLAAVALIFGAIDAAHMPAAAALPPQLLPRENLPAGQGLVQTLERIATIVGAPIGGFIVALGGLNIAAVVNVGLFCLALLILRGLRLRTTTPDDAIGVARPTNRHEGVWRSLRAGLRYVVRDSLLGPILLVVSMLNIAVAAPLNVGIALLAHERGWQAGGFSAIIAGFGIGATAGALSILRFRPTRRPATIGLLWVALGSVCVAGLGIATQLPVAAAIAAVLGFTSGPASSLLLGLVQAHAKTEYLGRVMALVAFSALGLVPVAYAGFGLLVSATTISTAFVICAVAELLTALGALCLRQIRVANYVPSQSTPSASESIHPQ